MGHTPDSVQIQNEITGYHGIEWLVFKYVDGLLHTDSYAESFHALSMAAIHFYMIVHVT